MMLHHAAQKPRDRLGDDDLAFTLQHPDHFEAQVYKSSVFGIANRCGQEDQRRPALVDISVPRKCQDESLPFTPISQQLICSEHPTAERIYLGPPNEVVEPRVELAQ